MNKFSSFIRKFLWQGSLRIWGNPLSIKAKQSLFIIEIIYKDTPVNLEEFKNKHKEFYKKYYKSGVFILSGNKNPEEGGLKARDIIIAKSKDREKIEVTMQENPLIIHNLAIFSISEFTPKFCSRLLGGPLNILLKN